MFLLNRLKLSCYLRLNRTYLTQLFHGDTGKDNYATFILVQQAAQALLLQVRLASCSGKHSPAGNPAWRESQRANTWGIFTSGADCPGFRSHPSYLLWPWTKYVAVLSLVYNSGIVIESRISFTESS